MRQEIDKILSEICDEDTRYRIDAYDFVLEALSYSQKKFQRSRHVTSKELLEGIKLLLMEQFGPMSLTVLKYWGINSTDDFGNIVFNLVNKRVLSKTAEDNIENFKDVYDFETVFNRVYRRRMEKKVSQLR